MTVEEIWMSRPCEPGEEGQTGTKDGCKFQQVPASTRDAYIAAGWSDYDGFDRVAIEHPTEGETTVARRALHKMTAIGWTEKVS